MGCQKKIAHKNADYLLAVKDNQAHLEQAFYNYFDMITLKKQASNSYTTSKSQEAAKKQDWHIFWSE